MTGWRTLIRVDRITKPFVYVVIPAWSPHDKVRILREDIPAEILSLMEAGQIRFHAEVNLRAVQMWQLNIHEWELE